MIERVAQASPSRDYQYSAQEATQWSRSPADAATQSASSEVNALWYQSGISSLAPPEITKESPSTEQRPAVQEVEKSWFSRAKDWLKSLFSFSSKEDTSSIETEGRSAIAQIDEDLKFTKKLSDANRSLVRQLKEMVEFEDEITKSLGSSIDKIIFIQLVQSSLRQKELKEENGTIAHKLVFDLQKRNQSLRETYYHLLDEINRHEKIDSVLKWTNVGLTVGILGTLAVTYATGGVAAVLLGGAGRALLYFGKGGTTLSQGILNYKNNLKTGELFMVNQDSKLNISQIKDEVGLVRMNDEAVAQILKAIREQIENQSRAERADAGNKS